MQNVVKSHFFVPASADDLTLGVDVTIPVSDARAIVHILHGMCEHKERYENFMMYLSAQGFICVCHDHRGHGESVKSSADLGYMYDGGAEALVEDVRTVAQWAKNRYPGLPLVVLGHSMGSMAARAFVRKYDAEVDGLIVCGSPSDNPVKGVGKLLAKFIGTIKGHHHRPQLLQQMSFGAFNRGFEQDGYHSAWVCSDREVLDAYHNDPLCQYVFTANGFYNLLSLMQACYAKKGWVLSKPELPIWFISGADDPCRTSNKAFNQSVVAMRKLGYKYVSSKTYPDMRHEILNETEKQVVWDDVVKMINEMIKKDYGN